MVGSQSNLGQAENNLTEMLGGRLGHTHHLGHRMDSELMPGGHGSGIDASVGYLEAARRFGEHPNDLP